MKQVRSVLELAVPAWHPGLTQSDSLDIERVQRAATNIILGPSYKSYKSALETLQLDGQPGSKKGSPLPEVWKGGF